MSVMSGTKLIFILELELTKFLGRGGTTGMSHLQGVFC